ncbi:MAG: hypothetical protein LBU89_05285 [Fibromonadaceae bacterium]|jgi:hypothetical protein|nr:hypothetical protein [Fibromonadaceae bacterium]
MKKIVLYSIIVTILAAAVALIIMLYIKNTHSDMVSSVGSESEYAPHEYIILPPPADDECADYCGEWPEEMQGDTENSLYNYHSDIVINDENIGKAASFASKFFKYAPFPFVNGEYEWISISNESPGALEWFIEKHDKNYGYGRAFMALFVQIYKNRAEYLNNGELLRYIKLLAGLVPHETYIANGWDTMVRQLLIAYNDLAATDSFRQVYEVMTSSYGNPSSYYGAIFPFASDRHEAFIMQQDAAYYKTGEVNQSAVVWAYSFWGRRYNENPDSVELIVAILRLLRDELYM